MTKYFPPLFVYYCLECKEVIYDLASLPRSHKSHLLVKATQFGRHETDRQDDYFADALDPDVQGAVQTDYGNPKSIRFSDEVQKRLLGEDVITPEEEQELIKKGLGETASALIVNRFKPKKVKAA